MATIKAAELSAADRQELADFADLLRAQHGMPPLDKVPEPVCILVRGRARVEARAAEGMKTR